MKRLRLVVLVLLLCPSFLKAQLSGTYTINPSSSQTKNYKTLSRAFRALDSQGVSGSVVFKLSLGTHLGQASLNNEIKGVSQHNRITFEGDTALNTNVVVRTATSSNLLIRKAKWLTFNSIYFQSTGSSGNNILLTDSASHNTFSNCLFTSGGTQISVRIYRSDSTVLDRCQISGGGTGVNLQGWSSSNGAQLTMRHCTIMKARTNGFYAYGHKDLTLFNNLMDSCLYSVNLIYGVRSNIQNNRFLGGQCTFSYENYHSSSSADSSRFYNNMVYAPGRTSIGLYCTHLYNTKVIHNSFHVKGGTHGTYLYGAKASVFLNNNWQSTGGAYGIYTGFSSSNAPAIFDYNNLSLSGTTAKIYFGSTTANSLVAIKAISNSYHQNSLDEDPTFYNPRNLESVSPLLNGKGLLTHLKTDINGSVRPAKGDTLPDIGCNDYQLPDWCLRIDGLLSPRSVSLSGNVIEARFKNAGAKTLDSQLVSFSYSVDSGKTWVLQRDSVFDLKPGGRLSYRFSQTWTPTRAGQFRIHIRTNFLVAGTNVLHEQMYDVCSGLAGTYYVGRSSFISLSTLLSKVNSCGLAGNTTIILGAGTYRQIALADFPRTNPNARLIIDGQHPDTAIVAHTTSVFEGTVDLNGASNVTFRNLTIQHDNGIGAGVRIWNGAHHNTIENCEILVSSPSTQYQNVGVAFSETYNGNGVDSFNIIQNNHIVGQYYGVKTAGVWGNSKRNLIFGNHIEKYYYYGIYAMNQQDVYVKGNRIENPSGTTNYPLYFYSCSGSKLHNNQIGDHALGLYWYYENRYSTADTSEFINNMVTGKYIGSAANVNSTTFNRCQHIRVYHNTFRFQTTSNLTNTSGTGIGTALRIYFGEHVDLRNNVFESVHTGATTVPFMSFGSKNWVAIEGNNYIHPSGRIASMDNTVYTSLASWQLGMPGYNQSAFSVPMKYDPLTHFRLSLNSANPRGVPSGVKKDIDGNTRCDIAPSIGASESAIGGVSFKVGFVSNDTLIQNAVETFLNTGGVGKSAATYEWYVDGVLTSTKTDLDYRFTTTGNHEIKLLVKTCSSSDSSVKTLPVVAPRKKPQIDFLVTKQVVDVNECVDILNLSQNGPDSFLWAASETGVGAFLPRLSGMNRTKWCNADTNAAKNPSVQFAHPGNFGVGLKARNVVGVDSLWKDRIIHVRDRADMCGVRGESRLAHGRIYDEGGPDGSYVRNRNACGFLIETCNDSTVLRFEEFQLAPGSFLKIYDGLSAKGIPLHHYSTNFSNGLTGSKSQYGFKKALVATSGFVYLEFSSGLQTDRGFHIVWSSEGKSVSPPSPHFALQLPDTVCEGALFDIIAPFNPSFILKMEGITYPDFTPVGTTYATTSSFKTPGVHNVKVVYKTCAGVDSFLKSIVVVSSIMAARAQFSVSNRNPEVNERVQLIDQSASRYPCISGWLWKVEPSGKRFSYTNGTDSTSRNPQVIFLDTGYYDIQLTTTNSFGTNTLKMPRAVNVYRTCVPTVKSPNLGFGITRMSLDTFSNISNVSSTGYQDFTQNAPMVLKAGFKYPISISTLSSSNSFSRAVWIDFNKDGNFDDSLEKVASSTSSNLAYWSDSIYIPYCKSIGRMKMRIGVELGNQPQYGCGPSIGGEFEDYMLEIHFPTTGVIKVVLVGNADTTIAQCQKWVDPGAYAWSVAQGRFGLKRTFSNVDASTLGTYTILYEAEDACGNKYVSDRIVRVTKDVLEPTIQLVGGDTLWVNPKDVFVDPGVVAIDLCDGNISNQVKVSGTVNTYVLGTYKLTYEVSDSEGNKAIKTRLVIVEDKEAPTLDELVGGSPITTEVNTPFIDPGVKWLDNYATVITTNTTGTVDITTLGNYFLSYTGTDPSGNVSQPVSRIVKVEDTKPPTVDLAFGKDTVIQLEVHHSYKPETVYLLDNYSSLTYLQSELTLGGTYPQNFGNGKADKLGTYTYIYTTKDESGNIGRAIREIEVADRTVPVAELRAGGNSMTIARWAKFDPQTDVDLRVSDNFYDSSQITVTMLHNTVNTQSLGKYKVIFGIEDPSGNYLDYMVEVHVVDNAQTIGISKVELEAAVFPNPTTGHIQLQITSGNKGLAEARILNSQGQVVQSIGSWNMTEDIKSMDISRLNGGLYCLEIQSSDQVLRKRITLVK